ncbi:MAG: phosphopantothenoylcysteine decarboxylase [Candidatus Altarchaeum sp.]|nr:phosphopantothenoylcysteine decarboxylase [Candidatus Altarchaeum sp.]
MKILIAAGATKEYIDAIKFISNDSSGKMGIALLKEAIKRKHKVKFIYGSGSALTKKVIEKISDMGGVEKVIGAITYDDFKKAVLSEISDCEIFICPAAISDWTVEKKNFKIKSNSEILLKLKPTEKIVKLAKQKFPYVFVVAFKAEYNISDDALKNSAIEKLMNENLNMIVANDVAWSKFGSDKGDVFLISRNATRNKIEKIEHLKGSKRTIARKIFISLRSEIFKNEVFEHRRG